MNTGIPIRTIDEGSARFADHPDGCESTVARTADDFVDEGDLIDFEPVSQRQPWFIAAFVVAALTAVAAWTGLFVWSHQSAMRGAPDLAQCIAWLSQWSLPVLLIAVAWLLVMRSSTQETARFGNAAHRLAQESAALEARLITVNRELSLAREFLAAQSRDLDYLGRVASERISEHADALQALIASNGAQVDAIASVSTTALANMTALRDNLPVVANSARDVTNQIGSAGRGATAQLDELVAGFARLNEFGQASERQVASLRVRIDTVLTELNARIGEIDGSNDARVNALRDLGEELAHAHALREDEALAALRARGELLEAELAAAHEARGLEEATALAAMRGRIATFTQEAQTAAAAVRSGEREAMELFEGQIAELRSRLAHILGEISALDQKALDTARAKLAEIAKETEEVDQRLALRDRAFDERMACRRADLDASEALAFAQLTQRSEALDQALHPRFAAQSAHAQAIEASGNLLAQRTAEIEARLATIVERSAAAEAALTGSAGAFTATVADHGAQLADSEAALARLTDASVRVLELIQAAARHSAENLPAAIAGFEQRLVDARDDSDAIRAALDEARRSGEELRGTLAEMHTIGGAAIGEVEDYRLRLAEAAGEQTLALARVRETLANAQDDGRALTETLSTSLLTALEQLKSASATALADYEADNGVRIASLAERIGDQGAVAIEQAIQARTSDALAQIDTATAHTTETAQRTLADLRDQLARVHELTLNLEARAQRARAQVEEQVDSDFSRRVALITESLNSHSIDIAKALSTEVTDTDWASYLRGDRGVFTRRAVRLVDAGEARQIAELFESDHDFRAHVSRYIHDFEAMLRTMLSTRDGHALGVTLLSSDMGKLYVTLAQAIQRLRQ